MNARGGDEQARSRSKGEQAEERRTFPGLGIRVNSDLREASMSSAPKTRREGRIAGS